FARRGIARRLALRWDQAGSLVKVGCRARGFRRRRPPVQIIDMCSPFLVQKPESLRRGAGTAVPPLAVARLSGVPARAVNARVNGKGTAGKKNSPATGRGAPSFAPSASVNGGCGCKDTWPALGCKQKSRPTGRCVFGVSDAGP